MTIRPNEVNLHLPSGIPILGAYRAEDARDRQSGGGTGLGLAITERAVRMHGGSVQAVNAADGGLAVEMKLGLSTDYTD